MPILRRYVRVSKYTVLEARIFLLNPADLAWFTRTEVISRVFSEIKPLVLPMLAEAKLHKGAARVKAKEKQVVIGEDFEVSVYLTRGGSLHAVLRKDRRFEVTTPIRGKSTKMMDAASSPPVAISTEEEDDEGETVDLSAIPEAPQDEPLFLPRPNPSDDSDDDFVPLPLTPTAADESEDKKELKFTTEYEGFTIYDKVLCLVVTRKQKQKAKGKAGDQGGGLIEGWIAMSQAVRDGGIEAEE